MAKKRFSNQQRKMLEGIQARLIASEHFQVFQSSAEGDVDRDEIAEKSPQDFAALLGGHAVEKPESNDKHHARIPWRCYPSYRNFITPKDEDAPEEPMFVPLPLDEESASELRLQLLSLCMCNLRSRLAKSARPDEWPVPSKPIWQGSQRLVCPGEWDEYEPRGPGADDDNDEEDEKGMFASSGGQVLSSESALAELARWWSRRWTLQSAATFFQDGLKSLLSESSTLTSLDLRGNGLTREDANVLLSLIEQQHSNLEKLNQIPVVADKSKDTKELNFDGTGIQKDMNENDEDQDIDDPEGEALPVILEAEYVRMDEGDGVIFYTLVTPEWFPVLTKVVLRHLEIPQAGTLAYITDALLSLTSVRELVLSELKLSGRGASLLLQAVAEMAQNQHLDLLNGLPLGRLLAQKEGATPLQLPGDIEWNDFPLGAMARLNLWPVAALPQSMADGGFNLRASTSLTDVGLRGLCVMLRHFAGQAQASSVGGIRSAPPSLMQLTKIDLSGNGQITDDTVADLCHTLQHPSTGASLRHSLRDLSVRSCMKLKARSALELQSFVMHIRDAGRGGSESGGLQTINGLDLEALQNAGRASTSGSRREGLPPMTLRTYVEPDGAGKGEGLLKPNLPTLSECDVLFFACMLHLWPHIPHCHVHVVLPRELMPDDRAAQGGFLTWSRDDPADDGMFGGPGAVTNDSPYPPPSSSAKKIAAAIQAHFDAARRLFEACPTGTQLRFSASPAIPDCEAILAHGDHRVLGLPPSTAANADRQGELSSFAKIKQILQGKAQARRRKIARSRGEHLLANAQPARPLYVNNINSQRLHCHFRTLYGKDEMDIEHGDIMPDERYNVCLPTEVDISQAFAVATSVDLQHLELCPAHLDRLCLVTDMPVLTHLNLNNNLLGDAGVEMLFRALVDANSSVVHVALASNGIGDEGATTIALNLGSLPRLTSLELCDNFIQERGSIAIADAIGGYASHEEADGEEAPQTGPLPVLSVDLRGNRSRELGARRWAEVVAAHPDLKFLCLAQNELGMLSEERFLDLVCAAVASASLSVLDLQDNFPQEGTDVKGRPIMGPPPTEVIEDLLADYTPAGEFAAEDVRRAVFIRRHRGGGGAAEKKGRQPQQGQQQGSAQRHSCGGTSGGAAAGTPGGASVPMSPSAASLAPSAGSP
eukprot:CAMPEP_0177153396 /NCGR_PEP_ID=MMETSP0367-20130122/1055_1 /TAXON_ID=447022 ORGANISM="Scrippsiella hangoei-like, Strain SHHI-4" /NCGR_SAMPLE_ID=MMETSP0367 /ASSEMBLY_ACC=CAM_ASM_000362 /LENGTH=1164 /DNA_ID=CAMNT_0018598549 /DNA_START=58 /DNA_END=3555 /DNA_ORIENTATION=+